MPAARSSAGVTKRVSEMQRAFGLEIEAGFQAGKDADEQVVHACQALGLSLDQIAASADEQPDLEVDLGGGLDRAQIGAGANLVGDGAGVARVGLVLAADGALAGTVDGQARDVNQREAGCRQHGLCQAGDAAHDVEADADGAARATASRSTSAAMAVGVFGSLRSIRTTPSASMAVTQWISLAMSIPTLMLHGALRRLKVRHPARAVVALHSDGSQSLISGRGGMAVPGDLPPEPSGQPA